MSIVIAKWLWMAIRTLETNTMPTDNRDILEVVKAELELIQKCALCRSLPTPWLPTSIFRDSPTCLNFADPERTHPCEECLLMALVPPEHRWQKVPCHHIPLTQDKRTVDFLEQNGTQDELEETVSTWLRRMIAFLE